MGLPPVGIRGAGTMFLTAQTAARVDRRGPITRRQRHCPALYAEAYGQSLANGEETAVAVTAGAGYGVGFRSTMVKGLSSRITCNDTSTPCPKVDSKACRLAIFA
jgi:hypothetical protein